ncbi:MULTISPECIES: NADPH:quinone reductase [Rhizobiaceae]|uniref:NADPH:quinone reductase n=1 Tax=Rhizobiaceae TaxID=82115 RepID=UPI000E3C9600|nr:MULTISPECIES: NADPH:quinone reductase [Rhizobiaceae]MBB3594967.1 NADPH:quinone reductase-like Zn-dependent oxidoreductase [Rhizobium sp. BK529]MBX4893003.1 NADPH:quinone reductase [Rhizobium bangladeshense]MBX4917396.1 NADPH:quinone reductase [Rhizobium bangladeshense]MDF1631438.1 NADPH:quinone reductase [Mycoplana sp. MJR14]QSY97508.1 NADPH:quinone reductase [Rhizobium bangladeshense]
MRAAFYDRQGPAKEVLAVGELPDPQPGAGEVRVRVVASGINPSDIKTRTGFGGKAMPFPRIVPHQDGAGVIDAVGPGVHLSRVGERVWIYMGQWGRAFGTAAEFVVVPSVQAVRLADNASFEIAAALGVPAMTAHRCLFADGDLRGKRVLVQGGAGAVGNAAILLAKWAGAWVAATVSREQQAEVARAAGADLVVNRREENVAAAVRSATGGNGVDRIVDVDISANIDVAIASLARDGVVSAYSTESPDAKLTIPFFPALLGGFSFRFVYVYTMPESAMRQAADEVSACAASGVYAPLIAKTYALDEVAEAHELQESGKAVGKILLRIQNA